MAEEKNFLEQMNKEAALKKENAQIEKQENDSKGIESLKEEYGDVYITDSNTIPNCETRLTGSLSKSLTNLDTNQSNEVNLKVKNDSEISDANYIKRYLLYPLINQVLLGDGTVQNHLEKCSLPKIKVSDRGVS